MNPDLDAKLCVDFPLLYRDRYGEKRSTLMCWGFECGDGWEPLIRRLSERLEAIIAALPDDESRPAAMQVKEKYGTLRFYMTASNDEIEALIDDAEAKSSVTCETCGAPGRLRGKWWRYAACDAHDHERRRTTRKGGTDGE